MAEKVSLIISIKEPTATATKRQKSVTDVSATATDEQLYSFAHDLIALTTDVFLGVEKVTRKELEVAGNG